MQIRLRRVPRAWRGPHSLQLGSSAGVATVVDGLDARDRELLLRLAAGIGTAEVPDDAAAAVLTPADDGARHRARELVALLTRCGMVEHAPGGAPTAADIAAQLSAAPAGLPLGPDPDADATTWGLLTGSCGTEVLRQRAQARVAVVGEGRAADLLRALLQVAGAGVLPSPLSTAALDHLTCDLVVLVGSGAADAPAAAPLVAADVPHLSLVTRETDGVVGPLVVPGATACLTCLDLHRADADPLWPEVVRQLVGRRASRASAESSLVVLLCGAAAGVALAHLDMRGRAGAPREAVTVQLGLAAAAHARRTWHPHPACGCTWSPGDPADGHAAEGPTTAAGAAVTSGVPAGVAGAHGAREAAVTRRIGA